MGMSENHAASKEKSSAALSSVIAAVVLAVFKLVVGILTNSLGILSEAAHSGLDLVAALVTFFAIRIADKPPDREHQYGHGKVENLSALIETLLLLGTCGWIIYEALHRLLATEMEKIDASVWAFAVMGISIIVDLSRSRMLRRAAQKHRSQALEADALHFSTDIWSSSVVIVGLALVRLADLVPSPYREWLLRADAGAALIVAGIIVVVSLQLGKRTVDGLLDRAPEGLADRFRAIACGIEHVQGCEQVRLRTSGPVTFVELTVKLAPDLPTAQAHQVAGQVKAALLDECPNCEAMVYAIPAQLSDEDIAGQARGVAAEMGLAVHDIHVRRLEGGYHVDVDVEVPDDLPLSTAHERVSHYEETLDGRLPQVTRVTASIQAAHGLPEQPAEEVTARYPELVAQIAAVVAAQPHFAAGHEIRVCQVNESLHVDLHTTCPGNLAMKEVDAATAELRKALRAAFPQVAHFLVHVEPEG
jgi:cation diffusion facilitator family transporter